MALAVVISPNGIPVSSAPSPYGFPVIVAANGFGVPVTPVASGGRSVFDVGGTLFGPATIPVNTGVPIISGTTIVGNTLLTSSGTWSGSAATYTYQWKRGGVAIGGATSSTYLLVSADVGTMITVTVTATNTAGNASATSAAVGPVTNVPIVLQADVGSFLFTGEDMTPLTGYLMQADAGAFVLADPGTTKLTPPGVAFGLTYQGKVGSSNTSLTTQSYGPISFAAGATRTVAVIQWYGGPGQTVTAVSIGAVTFAAVSGALMNVNGVCIDVWESTAPVTGTSGTVSVTYAVAPNYHSGVGLYNLNTSSPTATSTAKGEAASGVTSVATSTPLVVPSGGRGLVAAFVNLGETLTANNFTVDDLYTTGGTDFTWGHTTATGSITPSISWAGADGGSITSVAWGP